MSKDQKLQREKTFEELLIEENRRRMTMQNALLDIREHAENIRDFCSRHITNKERQRIGFEADSIVNLAEQAPRAEV